MSLSVLKELKEILDNPTPAMGLKSSKEDIIKESKRNGRFVQFVISGLNMVKVDDIKWWIDKKLKEDK